MTLKTLIHAPNDYEGLACLFGSKSLTTIKFFRQTYGEDDLIESLPNLIEVTGLKNPLLLESDSLKRLGLKIDGYLRKDYLKRLPNL